MPAMQKHVHRVFFSAASIGNNVSQQYHILLVDEFGLGVGIPNIRFRVSCLTFKG